MSRLRCHKKHTVEIRVSRRVYLFLETWMNIVSPAISAVEIQEIELLMERSRPVERIHAASLSAAALRRSATATHEEAVTAVAAWSVPNESLSSESRPNLSNQERNKQA